MMASSDFMSLYTCTCHALTLRWLIWTPNRRADPRARSLGEPFELEGLQRQRDFNCTAARVAGIRAFLTLIATGLLSSMPL
jgi:hypothetical protein